MNPIGMRAEGTGSRGAEVRQDPSEVVSTRQRGGHSVSKDAQTGAVLVLPGAEGVWARASRLPLELSVRQASQERLQYVPGYIH